MQNPFAVASTAKLNSTVTNQTLALPTGVENLLLYNGSTAVIYFRVNPTGVTAPAVVPGAALVDGLGCVPPSVTEVFTVPPAGGTLNYIADTTGGTLTVTLGMGS